MHEPLLLPGVCRASVLPGPFAAWRVLHCLQRRVSACRLVAMVLGALNWALRASNIRPQHVQVIKLLLQFRGDIMKFAVRPLQLPNHGSSRKGCAYCLSWGFFVGVRVKLRHQA